MLLLLRAGCRTGIAATDVATTGLVAMPRLVVTRLPTAARLRFTAGNAVPRGQLDFQLDDFVPHFVAAVPFRNRKQFAEPAAHVQRLEFRLLHLDGRVSVDSASAGVSSIWMSLFGLFIAK